MNIQNIVDQINIDKFVKQFESCRYKSVLSLLKGNYNFVIYQIIPKQNVFIAKCKRHIMQIGAISNQLYFMSLFKMFESKEEYNVDVMNCICMDIANQMNNDLIKTKTEYYVYNITNELNIMTRHKSNMMTCHYNLKRTDINPFKLKFKIEF